MKRDTPHILLLNPWIHDFAAYDFWAKPLGLLYLAAILRQHGLQVSYRDCLDRFHPSSRPAGAGARNGRGPYRKTRIPKPGGLGDVPRNFSRYGIDPQWLREDLGRLPRPDLVLVTSLMTYWYPGTCEAIGVVKEIWPQAPVILGGIYASLCPEHAAAHTGADRIVTGPGEAQILGLVAEITGYAATPGFDADDLDTYPYPALDLQPGLGYVPLLTSRGCPFRCTYCASYFLNPRQMRRSPQAVVDEIGYWHARFGINDFAFYDDALLEDAPRHVLPLLEKIIAADIKVRFHTPNAVHVRGITPQTAPLMVRAGFKTLRLGLETAAFEHRTAWDRKVTAEDFKRAVGCLKAAGFDRRMIGAYLLVGLPDQTAASIEDSIQVVKQAGITPVLAYYAPIPHTALWPRAKAVSRYDLEADPVFTNNAVFPCQPEPFAWEPVARLKRCIAS